MSYYYISTAAGNSSQSAICYEIFLVPGNHRSQIMTSTCEDSSKITDTTLSVWGGTLDIQESRKQKKLELPQRAVSLDNAKVLTGGKKNSGSKQINLSLI